MECETVFYLIPIAGKRHPTTFKVDQKKNKNIIAQQSHDNFTIWVTCFLIKSNQEFSITFNTMSWDTKLYEKAERVHSTVSQRCASRGARTWPFQLFQRHPLYCIEINRNQIQISLQKSIRKKNYLFRAQVSAAISSRLEDINLFWVDV